MNIAIVAAPYHPQVKEMIRWSEEEIEKSDWSNLVGIRRVSGAFEIPLQASRLLASSEVDAVITLGAIERGETGHGVAIANAVFSSLLEVSLQTNKPIALGIIGPNATKEQISSRAEPVARDAFAALRNLREKDAHTAD